MASIAAMLPASKNAPAAQPSAAEACDGDFDSVLASYAPANDTAKNSSPASVKTSIQVSSSNDSAKPAPSAIKSVKGIRAIDVAKKVAKPLAKPITVAKTASEATDSRPVDAGKEDAKVDAAVSPIAPVAASQPVPSPVAFPVGALLQQAVEEPGDSSDEDAVRAAAVKSDPTLAAPKSDAATPADPLAASEQRARPQQEQVNVPLVDSSDAPKVKAATAISAQAMDAIAAAAKAQPQKPESATLAPAPQTGIGSITAMLNAVRGTITSIVTPKQPAAARPEPMADAKNTDAKNPGTKDSLNADAKPVPAVRVADVKPAATQIQPDDDAAEPVAQSAQQTAQDATRDRISSPSDKVARPQPAVPAPSGQLAAPAVANVNGLAAIPAQPVGAGTVSTAANATDKASPNSPQNSVPSNISALATAIAAKSAAGTKTFDIRMDPPELGRVDVHLSVDRDGKVEALLRAEHPQTLALLQRDSQNLERALKDAGLNLSNNSLNFSLKGEQRQGDGGGASMARARSLPDAVVARAEAANASEINFSAMRGNGRLDIRV